jgi:hypothetical protein
MYGDKIQIEFISLFQIQIEATELLAIHMLQLEIQTFEVYHLLLDNISQKQNLQLTVDLLLLQHEVQKRLTLQILLCGVLVLVWLGSVVDEIMVISAVLSVGILIMMLLVMALMPVLA